MPRFHRDSASTGKCRISPFVIILLFAATLLVGFPLLAQELTVQALRDVPDLTPQTLMSYFKDFSFRLGDELQDPDVFLATRTGDCDDFASLAALVLGEKKFTTKLIAIFMEGQTHVVCYVQEAGGYLDYNCRDWAEPLQCSNGQLEDIAEKVSAYFRTAWRIVAEFNSQAGIRRFGRIAFRGAAAEPPARKQSGAP